MNTKPQRAALLLRLSQERRRDDEDGDLSTEKVEVQERRLRELAKQMGWKIGPAATHVIVENNVSAYKRKRVTMPDGSKVLRTIRPEFKRLMGMIETLECDGLIAVDLDRSCRDQRDLADLIDAVEAHEPRFPVKSHSGSLDLSTDAGVTMAQIMVAVANKSSRDTARRQKDKQLALAEAGLPGGGGIRRFGFEQDGMTHRPEEVAAIKWMAQQVLDGQSIRSIGLELDRQGIATVKGGKWAGRTISQVLTNPYIAGRRILKGKDMGAGKWQPILEPEVFAAVKAAIENNGVEKGRRPLTYFVTGLLYCSECGYRLTTNTGGKARGYFFLCDRKRGGCGGVSIHGQRTTDLITEQVLGLLAKSTTTIPRETRVRVTGPAVTVDGKALEEDKQMLADLMAQYARREITKEEWEVSRAIVNERIEAAGPKVILPAMAPATAQALKDLRRVGTREGVWAALEPGVKRDVVLAILEQAGHKGWRVARATTNRFDAERLSLEPA